MANAYIDELYRINNRIAIGGSSQRRLFFDQQLAQEKDKLADAEVALKKTEEATGVIAPTGQMETIIHQVAQLRAEITAREIELDALRTSSTEQNPDVVRLNSELQGCADNCEMWKTERTSVCPEISRLRPRMCLRRDWNTSARSAK